MADGLEAQRPRAGSWASIENRVEKLEQRVSEVENMVAGVSHDVTGLSVEMKLISSEQSHQKELMNTRFTAVEALIGTLTSKVDNLLNDLRDSYIDIKASTVGQNSIDKDLTELNAKVAAQQKLFDQLNGMGIIYRYVAGAGVAALLMSAAALLHSLGVI